MIFLIALALALDALAVTVGIGASRRGLSWRPALRLAFHFGFFQFIMPILGWLAGEKIIGLIQHLDHWLAFSILAIVGSRMIFSGLKKTPEKMKISYDQTKGVPLIFLSVATSLDALAVGLSLPAMNISIWSAASIIGCVAFALTLVAAGLSPYLGRVAGQRAEVVGGLILIGIGLRILILHIT